MFGINSLERKRLKFAAPPPPTHALDQSDCVKSLIRTVLSIATTIISGNDRGRDRQHGSDQRLHAVGLVERMGWRRWRGELQAFSFQRIDSEHRASLPDRRLPRARRPLRWRAIRS